MYAAASLGFGLTEQLSASVTGKVLVDTAKDSDIQPEKAKNVYGIALNLDFQLDDHNSFGAGFEYQTCDNDYQVAVPLYWQWGL